MNTNCMSRQEIEFAIQKYARKHAFFAHTVRVNSQLRFAAIRAHRQEMLYRAAQSRAA